MRLEFPPIDMQLSMGGGKRPSRKTLSEMWAENAIDSTVWTLWKSGGGALDCSLNATPALKSNTPNGTFAGIAFNNPIARPKAFCQFDVNQFTTKAAMMICAVKIPTTTSGDIDQDFIEYSVDSGANRIRLRRNIGGIITTDINVVDGANTYHFGMIFSDLAANTYNLYANGNLLLANQTCGALLTSGYFGVYFNDSPSVVNRIVYLENAYGVTVSGF